MKFLTLYQFSASFNLFPALKPGTTRDGILTSAPVCGLRPVRAALFLAVNVPNPTNVTLPDFFRPFEIPSITASKALAAA